MPTESVIIEADARYGILPAMNAKDTNPEARRVLIELYRKMPPAVKLKCIFDAYQTGKMLAMAGLRDLHPDASEEQIWYLWAKRQLGDKVFQEVYGNSTDE